MKARLVDTTKADKKGLLGVLMKLQKETFPADIQLDVMEPGYWWIVWDENKPVAFAALRPIGSWEEAAYLARCGVIHSHRGLGIQRKLLLVRERKAKAIGSKALVTTTYENPTSANNLIKRGFVTYTPQKGWGATGTVYWIKEFK